METIFIFAIPIICTIIAIIRTAIKDKFDDVDTNIARAFFGICIALQVFSVSATFFKTDKTEIQNNINEYFTLFTGSIIICIIWILLIIFLKKIVIFFANLIKK